jgi:hypothetical protein
MTDAHEKKSKPTIKKGGRYAPLARQDVLENFQRVE